MSADPQHLFAVDGNTLVPTELVRGPWDHGLQHGGAVCGALGWAAASANDSAAGAEEFVLCRQTAEILRPVPAVPLRYQATIERLGKRSRVISAGLWHDDRCVARASTQWARVRPGPVVDVNPEQAVPLRPVAVTDPGRDELGYPRPGFNCDVFEFRCLQSTTEDPGPGIIWLRMKVQLIAGRRPDPVQVLTTMSDLGNAVGWEPSPLGAPMVNSDVTLQLFRYPTGDWICLESAARSTTAGIGLMDTVLWDGDGRLGRVLSTTMESAMPLSMEMPASVGETTAEQPSGAAEI